MIEFKKSLGQNFLRDNNIIQKIINPYNIKNKNILEIGPGKGALTMQIIKKKPKNFILIEKDKKLFEELKNNLNYQSVNVLNDDILKVDIEKIIKKNTIIFGNLPFNISTQILVKFVKFAVWPPLFSKLIFMFQKEVGEKILSLNNEKNYGRISIIANYRFKIKKILSVSKNCFFPVPKVDSLVLEFEPKLENFKINDLSNLENITHLFFSQKRKVIRKPFEKLFKNYEHYAQKFNLSLRERPSEIAAEKYYMIVQAYENQ